MTTAACRSCGSPMPCPCCRLYDGVLSPDGYGQVNLGKPRWDVSGRYKGRTPIGLHRWVMSQHLGRELLPDEVVMHECDQPACFFVGHLRLGTQAENLADMRAKGRGVIPAPHPRKPDDQCDRGHRGEIVRNARGRRWCRACRRHTERQVRLTASDIPTIRSLKGVETSRVVGQRFGVSSGQIRSIWSGGAWTHVPL